jgi:SAM-dependent methyltransferase
MTDRAPGSLPPAYFEALYAADPDPWRFETSDYERAKYAATIAALPAPRFAAAFEVGCSIGVLTRALAERCDTLLAVDVVDAALDRARARCADLAHVRFARMVVPDAWPDETFDLIVLSEVLYYLAPADIARVAARVETSLRPGGSALLVHWLGETNYPVTGDAAVDAFERATARLAVMRRERTGEYRLDLLRLRS